MAAAHLDPYAVLGVTLTSSPNEVRRAYYSLALLVHPDKGGDADQMAVVQSAYAWIMRGLTGAAATPTAAVTAAFETAAQGDFQAYLAAAMTGASRPRPLSELLSECYGVTLASFTADLCAALGKPDVDPVSASIAFETVMSRFAANPNTPLKDHLAEYAEQLRHSGALYPAALPGGYGDQMAAPAPTGAAEDDAFAPLPTDFGPRDVIVYQEPNALAPTLAPALVPADRLDDYTVYDTMADYRIAFQTPPPATATDAPPDAPFNAAYDALVAQRAAETAHPAAVNDALKRLSDVSLRFAEGRAKK